jgi:hypothetical protein
MLRIGVKPMLRIDMPDGVSRQREFQDVSPSTPILRIGVKQMLRIGVLPASAKKKNNFIVARI